MIPNGGIKKGDWIKANSHTGSQIIGQSRGDVSWGKSSIIEVVLDIHTSVVINTNFWDIEILHKELLITFNPSICLCTHDPKMVGSTNICSACGGVRSNHG